MSYAAKRTRYGWMAGGSASRVSGGSFIYPQDSSIIFQHNMFDGNTTAQVGSATYTRSGTLAIPTGSYSWTKFGANAMPIGMVRPDGSETMSGVYFNGDITNYCLYSEDFTNAAWASIGTGADSGGTADGPFGASDDADTISGSAAGDGLVQDIGVTAVSKTIVFSVFLKVTSGTRTIQIQQYDDGTEGGILECDLTTDWKRFELPTTYSASASGNVNLAIVVGDSDDVRAIGAQAEQFNSGSGGRRLRKASANAYVPTTTAALTAGTSSYIIPNAIVTDIDIQGSIAFWALHRHDFVDDAGPQYAFSIAGEDLAFQINKPTDVHAFYLDGAAVINKPDGAVMTHGPSPDTWSHYVITWDCSVNEYFMYRDGVEIGSGTTSKAAVGVSTNTMNLGGYNSPNELFALDGAMSEAVLWDAVLTSSEVAELYGNKQPVAIRSTPGTGAVFSVDLESSVIPTTGDTEYHYNHRNGDGVFSYYDSTTTLDYTTSLTYPLPAYPFGGTAKGGFQFNDSAENLLTQSQNLAHADWTTSGSGSFTANSTTAPDGTTTATLMEGDNGSGKYQDSGLTAASNEAVFSIYARAVSGTADINVIIEGASADQETVTTSASVGTTWERISVYASFTASAGGVVRCRVTQDLNNTDDWYAWGAQLEEVNATGKIYRQVGASYIPTTTAAVTKGVNTLVYRGIGINWDEITIIAWAYSNLANTADYVTPNGPTIVGAPGQQLNFYMHFLSGNFGFEQNNTTIYRYTSATQTAWQWTHYAVSRSVSAGTVELYIDGVSVESETSQTLTPLKHRKLILGGDHLWLPLDTLQGGLGTVDIYGSVQSTATILADFDATKAAYGRS